ncbi:MAG: nitroreductase family protein [Marinifilaceae bacterium]|jgi:nitroreductase/NAD-dependent dihydropyrimidine dehydrogenase PreA subunit|nr:nitroreductase family protein [Marinifilaceae bacterium]
MNITIDKKRCTSCGLCLQDCPSACIDIKNYAIQDSCIDCGHCIAICPSQAVSRNIEPQLLIKHELGTSNFLNFMSGIRSIRNYKDKEVDRELIDKLISEIKIAPSASNQRAVEYLIITDKNKIKQINDICAKSLNEKFSKLTKFPMSFIVKLFKGNKNFNKIQKYRNSIQQKIKDKPNFICYNAPVIIISHYPKKDIGMHQTDSIIWNTYISIIAKSFGLGTCINGFIETVFKGNTKLLKNYGISSDREVGSVLLLGYPKTRYANRVQRNSPKYKII